MKNVLDYNKDGEINPQDFFDLVVHLMRQQNKENNLLKGSDKKSNVLHVVEQLLGKESYDRYAPLLDVGVDFLHKHIVKRTKKWCCLSK